MSANDIDRLVKIVLQCDQIQERKERFGITEQVFVADAAYADLLLMPLAQIGELSVHVSDESLRNIMPLSTWKQVRGFRNVIVHSYGSIDRVWAWDTIVNDIPELRSCILNEDDVRSAYDAEVLAIASEATDEPNAVE